MTNQTTNLLLRAQVDQGAASQGVAALRQIQSATDAARDSFSKINDDVAKSSSVFQGLEEASKAIGRETAINDLAGQFANLAKSTGEYEALLGDLVQGLHDLGASDTEIDKATAAFKDLETQAKAAAQAEADAAAAGGEGSGISSSGLRSAGRALDQIGASSIGRPLQQLGDLGVINKELDSFGKSLVNLPGPLGDAAAGGVALAGGIGGFAIVALPVVGLVADLTLGLKAMDNATAELTADIGYATRTSQEYGKIISGTSDDALKSIQDLGKTQAELIAERDRIQQQLDDTFKTAQGQFGGDAGARIRLSRDPDYNNAVAQVAKLNQEILDNGKIINETFGDVQKGATAGADAAKASADAAEAAQKAQEELAAAELRGIQQRIQLENEADQLINTGTSKSVQDRIDAIGAESANIRDELPLIAEKAKTDKNAQVLYDQYTESLKNLSSEQKTLIDQVQPLVQAREDETKAIDDETKAHDDAVKALKKAQGEYQQASNEIDQLTADRSKQIKDEAEKDATDAYRSGVEKDYADRIAAAKRDEAEQAERDKSDQADADALTKYNDDRSKIVATEFDSEIKAYQNYIDAEKKQTDQANRQRLQTLETAQNDLKNLAASGDVAGFVQRSNQAKLDLKHLAENTDAAQQQLYDTYEKQVQAARDAETKQLDDLKTTYDHEKQVRDAAAQQRIQDIENQGNQANSKSSQLEQELNDIRAQWRQDDLDRQRQQESDQFDQRLAVQQEKQDESLTLIRQYWDQVNGSIPSLFGVTSGTPANPPGFGIDVGPSVPIHKGGLYRVPRDHYLSYLDEGERVLTKQQTDDTDRNGGSLRGGGDSYYVTVQNTVGDIATKSMLDQYQDETINGIKQTLIRSKGRGSQ